MALIEFLIIDPPTAASLFVGLSVTIAITTTLHRARDSIKNAGIEFLSICLDWYLHWKYPITNDDRSKMLPSLPYRWPNGNGDVAKFLEGRQNSEKWRNEYGSMYRIWAGFVPEVVVSQSEHLKAVFRDSDQHFKAINNDSGYLMSQILGQCVGLLSGKSWQFVRAKVEVPFTHQAIANEASIIREQTNLYTESLRRGGDFQAGIFDPARDMRFYPFLVVATIMYGKLDNTDIRWLKRIAPMREKLFTYVIKGGLARFSISRYFPTTANNLLNDFQSEWLRFNESIYEKAKARGADTPMINLWEDAQSGRISQIQLLQTLDESLFANLDVTTGAISWNFIYLAANTHYQSRLVDEIKNEGSGCDGSWDKYISRGDTFLAACINEASRLRPVAAFSIPQAPPTDRRVGEWIIPKRTMVVVDTYTLNIRNEFWGNEREQYRPERFMGLSAAQTRYQMWRFGFGPRQCMGKYVADRMVRSILAAMIKEYQMALRPEDMANNDFAVNPDEWITHPDVKLLCHPRRE